MKSPKPTTSESNRKKPYLVQEFLNTYTKRQVQFELILTLLKFKRFTYNGVLLVFLLLLWTFSLVLHLYLKQNIRGM